MYRNAYYNYKSKSIFLRTWNSSGDRIDLEIPYQPYLYVEHDAIKDGVSIFNTSLRKIEFEDSYKRKDIESRFLALCKVMQIYNSED